MKITGLKFSVLVILSLLVVAAIMIYRESQKTDDEIRRSAYAYAVNCAGKSPLEFEQLRWAVQPDLVFTDPITNETAKFAGWYSPNDTTIFLSSRSARSFKVIAHEILHSFGVQHEDPPFILCRLLDVNAK